MKRDAILVAGGSIFVDSGMISAMAHGRRTALQWANDNQESVAALARRVRASYVAHLDVPMERHKLAGAGLTEREAMQITLRNARSFLDADVGSAMKIYVLQGWDIEDYVQCINQFQDMGIPDGGGLGIGTCCMRPATRGLWQILERIRTETDGFFLHSFGTGDREKLSRLSRIGIDSVDEGNTIRALHYHERRLSKLIASYKPFDA